MAQEPIRRGDVYWVVYAFPHEKASPMTGNDDLDKQRPILILQNIEDNGNLYYPLVQAAPITTQKAERVYAQDVLLPAGEANLQRTSKVLLGLTQPFLKTHLGQRLGSLSPARMREVDAKLLRLFGLLQKRP
ncbi:type II toxin-antitoxin system PemK/MazF family toxin [Candidatus Amarolinea aalborgensis]|uniref:type II toxin-antitoxin system PemK/MazF family toxin n=1 Tax=Candidatus Amarolinea aalborgensis TaxID=2249329 RepID=UPI003BF968F8